MSRFLPRFPAQTTPRLHYAHWHAPCFVPSVIFPTGLAPRRSISMRISACMPPHSKCAASAPSCSQTISRLRIRQGALHRFPNRARQRRTGSPTSSTALRVPLTPSLNGNTVLWTSWYASRCRAPRRRYAPDREQPQPHKREHDGIRADLTAFQSRADGLGLCLARLCDLCDPRWGFHRRHTGSDRQGSRHRRVRRRLHRRSGQPEREAYTHPAICASTLTGCYSPTPASKCWAPVGRSFAVANAAFLIPLPSRRNGGHCETAASSHSTHGRCQVARSSAHTGWTSLDVAS